MEKLIAKYTAKLHDANERVTHHGDTILRSYYKERAEVFKEIVSDLEAKHRNCSCRTGLKWNQAEHDELLTDKEHIFKED